MSPTSYQTALSRAVCFETYLDFRITFSVSDYLNLK